MKILRFIVGSSTNVTGDHPTLRNPRLCSRPAGFLGVAGGLVDSHETSERRVRNDRKGVAK